MKVILYERKVNFKIILFPLISSFYDYNHQIKMYVEEIEIYQNYVRYLKKAHVRCLKILTWLRGFRSKIANFSRLHCLVIARRELSTKKTKPNIEKWPETLGVMSEFKYIECGLLNSLGLQEPKQCGLTWPKVVV